MRIRRLGESQLLGVSIVALELSFAANRSNLVRVRNWILGREWGRRCLQLCFCQALLYVDVAARPEPHCPLQLRILDRKRLHLCSSQRTRKTAL